MVKQRSENLNCSIEMSAIGYAFFTKNLGIGITACTSGSESDELGSTPRSPTNSTINEGELELCLTVTLEGREFARRTGAKEGLVEIAIGADLARGIYLTLAGCFAKTQAE